MTAVFHLGVNYWPSSSAMAWWQRFDAAEVERDFARIRSAGCDSVRIFLLWEDFQPAPDQVAEAALAHLGAVADSAARNGLTLVPTLFTGHMSGANWAPVWALGRGVALSRFPVVVQGKMTRRPLRNWYRDKAILEAQALFARRVAEVLHDHPALGFWDLGNEPSNCLRPPTRQAGIAWLERIAAEVRAVDPHHPITLGLHQADLERDQRLGPAEAARVCDFLCMHGYPMYTDWAEGPADEWVLPFLGLMTRWLGGKEVFFEEFGAPTIAADNVQAWARARSSGVPILSEEEGAQFTRRALEVLHRFGFMGAMLWCYGDYSPALWDNPPFNVAPHEPFFGLWRSDGSAKLAAAEIGRFAAMERRPAYEDFSWIDIERETFYTRPRHNLRRLYRRFREHVLYPPP